MGHCRLSVIVFWPFYSPYVTMLSCVVHATLLKFKADTLPWFVCAFQALPDTQTPRAVLCLNNPIHPFTVGPKGKLITTQNERVCFYQSSATSCQTTRFSCGLQCRKWLHWSGWVGVFRCLVCKAVLTDSYEDRQIFLCFCRWNVSSNFWFVFYFYPVTWISGETLFFCQLSNKNPVNPAVPSSSLIVMLCCALDWCWCFPIIMWQSYEVQVAF